MIRLCLLALLLIYLLYLHSKEVLRMKAELLSECRARMKFGDNGDYSSILGRLKKLNKKVSPSQWPSKIRPVYRALKTIIGAMYHKMEAQAIHKRSGVATILYAHFSGQAELAVLKQVDKACREYGAVEASPSGAAGGSRFHDTRRIGGRGRAASAGGSAGLPRGQPVHSQGASLSLSKVQCFECLDFGHKGPNCPAVRATAPAGE